MLVGVATIVGAGCHEVPRTYSTRAADGEIIVREGFDGDTLGPQWKPTGPGVTVQNGVLKLRETRNHPIWLDRPLPDNLRIEFDAWSASDEGDIKVELCGDGTSFATSPNYVASGYVVIFGGWENSLSAIVRKNEHGRNRVTTSEPKVEPDKRYHFVITRSGSELQWEINGNEILVLDDPMPLRGPGQRPFCFQRMGSPCSFRQPRDRGTVRITLWTCPKSSVAMS